MASYQDVLAYQEKLSQLYSSILHPGGGLPKGATSPQTQKALQDLTSAMQRSGDLVAKAGLYGSVPDDVFQRTQQLIGSTLSQNSDVYRNRLGTFGQTDLGGGQTAQKLLDQFSGTQSNQYINPTTGQPVSSTGTSSGITPTPTGVSPVDPNQPLSTPSVPVNQATAPSDINPYIPATSQQQQDIVNQAIAQSQGVAGQNFQQLQSVIDPWIQQQASQFTDPTKPGYQQMMGQLNNIGMADSGAFPQALADKLAPLISEGQMRLGEGTFLPAFMNQQNLVGEGAQVQSNLGLDSLQRFIEQQNWQQQAAEAEKLASQGASAQFGSGIGGLLGGGLGAGLGAALAPTGMGPFGALIGSQIGGGAGQAAGGGMSWICTHLKKLGLATESEVETVHAKLYPSIFKHPIHWLHYLLCAPRLIKLCDLEAMDWKPVKEVLIDAVLAEPDSEKAWQIYRTECQRLTLKYASHLWTLEVTPC